MAQVCMTKLIFLYSGKLQWWGGYQDSVRKFRKFFLTFLGLGTNVVKVSSVNSELLFQWDTLTYSFAKQKIFCPNRDVIKLNFISDNDIP